MARVTIKEYRQSAVGSNGEAIFQVPEPADVEQTPITLSGASQQSAAFTHKYLFVQGDADFYYEIGTNPNASANDFFVPAGVVAAFIVKAGDKIAVLTK